MNKRQWRTSVILASIGAVLSIIAAAQYFDIANLLRTQVSGERPCGFFGGGEVCTRGMKFDEAPVEVAICNDRIDNDKDGFVDKEDIGCYNLTGLVGKLDTKEITSADAFRDLVLGVEGPKRYLPSRDTEIGEPGCADKKDNDGDELTDENDPGCKDPQTTKYNPFESEAGSEAECNDELDNDNDGFVDANDPGCHPARKLKTPYDPDENEFGGIACSDRADNETKLVEGKKVSDGDGRVDKDDAGCHWFGWPSAPFRPHDTSEAGEASCANGKNDNNKDGVDADDPRCHLGGVLEFSWLKLSSPYLPWRHEI